MKVFCIGRNKTGTTSMAAMMSRLGHSVGNQHVAEKLLYDWMKREFSSLIEYCKTADFFQDIPFSLDYTYQALDIAFPCAKFILTIRPAEEWYRSLVNFHSLVYANGQRVTTTHLKNAGYIEKGWAYYSETEVYGAYDDQKLYDKETYINHYNSYNNRVIHYFKNKSNLLVLNLKESDAVKKLCDFLGKPYNEELKMPHENRTKGRPIL